MKSKQVLTKQEAGQYLDIEKKAFDAYTCAGEITGFKRRKRWYFDKFILDEWQKNRKQNIVFLSIKEYERCFEFAIKVVYGGSSLYQRSELEAAEDWISGILAEHAFKRFLRKRFKTQVFLDNKVHPARITAKDIIAIKQKSVKRPPKLFLGIKSSKMKSVYLIADEHGQKDRSADVYVFIRVGLPRDHLFRYLRNHSFIRSANKYLTKHQKFKHIAKLKKIPVWTCGFCYASELKKKRSIPGQKFTSLKYVKSCKDLRKSDKDWQKLIAKL